MKAPLRIYVAGRMQYREYDHIGRQEPLINRALLGIDLDKSDGKDDGNEYKEGLPEPFWFGIKQHLYVGPFCLGDNHGCLNDAPHHLIDSCSYGNVTQETVVQVCKRQIASADLVFAWLGDDSLEAHGTLAEIGYAKGLGKLTVVAYTPADSPKTWFAKKLADAHFECDDFLTGFRHAVILAEDVTKY